MFDELTKPLITFIRDSKVSILHCLKLWDNGF
jgi:hypothetical protein